MWKRYLRHFFLHLWTFWNFFETFLELFWNFFGNFLKLFWNFFETFSELFWNFLKCGCRLPPLISFSFQLWRESKASASRGSHWEITIVMDISWFLFFFYRHLQKSLQTEWQWWGQQCFLLGLTVNTQLLIEESFDVVACFLRCHITSIQFTRFPNSVLSITWFNSWISPALILSEQFAKAQTQRKLSASKCSGPDIHSVANSDTRDLLQTSKTTLV